MRHRKYGKYFRQNMRLFTTVFMIICMIIAGIYLWNTANHQMEKIETNYQNNAQISSAEIDNRLYSIRKLMNNISQITWVKKLASSSEVFMADFTDLQRLEYQKELSRYLTVDGSISDIAIFMADRGIVLCQKGLFTEAEYKAYLRTRCDLDLDELMEKMSHKSSIDSFPEAEYNLNSQKNIVLSQSLIDVTLPAASLIIILNKDAFVQGISKLGNSEMLGISALNQSGKALFSTSNNILKEYHIEIDSKVFSLRYCMTYPQPSETLSQYEVFNLTFFFGLLIMLTIAVLASFLLSLHNNRPIQKLMNKINGVAGKSYDSLPEATEFEQIENSFVLLYRQKQNLQDSIRENYHLTRQYAIMLTLSCDNRFTEWMQHFEELGIPFTEDQLYSVWIITVSQESPEKIIFSDMLSELQPQLSSMEEIRTSSLQSILIMGQDPNDPFLNADETAEWMKSLALQRYNILLTIKIGKTYGPGIASISQSYHELIQPIEKISQHSADAKPGKAIVKYITQNYCDPDLSLKYLSDQWNLSVPTVSRLCKEALGISFLDYLTSLRLEKAKELLLQSNKTPLEISLDVGYASEYSFRRAFQRNENCRLQDWMEAHQN